MALTRVQSASATNTANTAPKATLGSTPASGNLLVADFSWNEVASSASLGAVTTGWTLAISSEAAGHIKTSTYYKTAGASEATAVSGTLAAAVDWCVTVAEYNQSTGGTWNVDLTTSDFLATTTTTPDSGTNARGTTVAAEVWHAAIGTQNNLTTQTSPTNGYSSVRQATSTNATAGQALVLGMYDKIAAATAASATVAVTLGTARQFAGTTVTFYTSASTTQSVSCGAITVPTVSRVTGAVRTPSALVTTASMVRQTGKRITPSALASAPSVVKQAAKSLPLVSVTAAAAALTALKVRLATLTASVGSVAQLGPMAVTAIRTATVTGVPTLPRAVSATKSAVATLVPAVVKQAAKTFIPSALVSVPSLVTGLTRGVSLGSVVQALPVSFQSQKNARLVQQVVGSVTGSNTLVVSLPSAPTDGNLLVALFSWDRRQVGAVNPVSITQTGATWVEAGSSTPTSGSEPASSVWYAQSVSAASSGITFTMSASANGYYMANVQEYAAIGALDVTGKFSVAGTPSYALSGAPSGTISSANELIVSSMVSALGSAPTNPTNGFTALSGTSVVDASFSTTYYGYGAYNIVSAVGSYSPTWTVSASAGDYTSFTASFVVAAPTTYTGKLLSGTVGDVASLVRAIGKTLTTTAPISLTFQAGRAVIQALSATVQTVASLVQSTVHPLVLIPNAISLIPSLVSTRIKPFLKAVANNVLTLVGLGDDTRTLTGQGNTTLTLTSRANSSLTLTPVNDDTKTLTEIDDTTTPP